jgi:diguanylate cyclase (GGDEF)-like protein/PAS domain S-box-containing protein
MTDTQKAFGGAPSSTLPQPAFSRRGIRQAIDQLALALATQTNDSFFHALANELLLLMPCHEVFVTAIDPERPGHLKLISHLAESHLCSVTDLNLVGTPFEDEAVAGVQVVHASLSEHYPLFHARLSLPAEAFFGVTFYAEDGLPIGFLFLLYPESIGDLSLETALIQTFTDRISGELERRRSDDALRLSAVAFETHEGIVITDPNRLILRANKAFTQISGFSSEEVQGQPISKIFRGIEQDLFKDCLRDQRSQGEFYRVRRSGERYPQWETLTPVTDSHGVITHYVLCFEDMSSRKETEQQIQNLAFYDELTGLLNRRKLHDELEAAFHAANDHENIGALLFIDLDYFKNINDSLGHAAGDWLLKQVAERLKNLVRQGDLLARIGGDEFVLLLPDLGGNPPQAEQQASLIGQRLIDDISSPYRFDGQELHIGASVGISLFPARGQQPGDLLKQADTAMYHAKSAGRRSLMFFEVGMQIEADTRLQVYNALRSGLVNNELVLHYQPQHHVVTGELVGAEALVRWLPPGGDMVMPDGFIPIAEETDLILDIGLWVLHEGCRQFQVWVLEGATLPSLSINVSTKQFHSPDFVDQVISVLEDTHMDPSKLNLEITESVVLSHAEDAIDKMGQLKAMGISFSIDDFGAGYSSLAYLKRLPADELKIDRSFIEDIPTDQRDMAIVATVLAIASHLGFSVMAEGVETVEQLDFLKDRRCDSFQGYLASKPLAPEDMLRYIRQTSCFQAQ